MAEFLTRSELRNYPLSTGATVDLVALIGTSTIDRLTNKGPNEVSVGDVAYVSAMGNVRRGVVVKVTRTRVHVALTTQGAVDSARQFEIHTGHADKAIRVQTTVGAAVWVEKAPAAPAPVEAEEPTTTVDTILARQAERDAVLTEMEETVSEAPATQMDEELDTEVPAELVGADNDAHLPVAGVEGTSLGEMREAFRDEDETEAPIVRELTGSSVVKLLERVHERIRQNHPEVPEVVIVTGSGADLGGQKWGHFRPQGWTTGQASVHEMFMAGETLAKGSRQVLQTMLHESAHALAEHRGEKDTSRQGRWHNQVFRKTAEELGLEYKGGNADKTIGFSAVTLTAETVEEYKDLLEELDQEICLMVRLPGWLGGSDQDGEQGGHSMGKAPQGTETKSTSNVKLTCKCEEPNIIRASKKVADKMVVNCGDCDALFLER
jgi:hypothetical protein